MAKIITVRFEVFIAAFLLLLTEQVAGQLSQGGRPLNVPLLKSRGIPVITMPVVDNEEMQIHYEELQLKQPQLKPFVFAHTFDVDISPANTGIWIRNFDGYDVWRVNLKSVGAYSINLIFENFQLPEGARLFIFNENEGYFLGAFTSDNNRESGIFAVSPVAGDEISVQYEVPSGAGSPVDFMITHINHDFIGILKVDERRPTGTVAGGCNVNVNCGIASQMADQADAVCRIIINGREICTGVLMNNTAQDQRPYILSASHCYDRAELAEKSVFVFNYESPYCNSIDGDPLNSISGAEMKAFSDNLDFALVEMNNIPPKHFSPYYAGWNRLTTLPDSSFSIHHPQGGIKKISIDRDAPSISDFSDSYTANGFLRIHRWDEGVTEQGSSGGPLFNPAGLVIGTLTGGNATCRVPVNDYYSRFSLAWEFRSDQSQQLKHWLDPLNLNRSSLSGNRYYTGENLCTIVTNLNDSDDHSLVAIGGSNGNSGYWGGTNNIGISEIAEKFMIGCDAQLQGVSLGVARINLIGMSSESEITIKIYNGSTTPQSTIYEQQVMIGDMVENAMNYIPFDETVEPSDTFFVSIAMDKLQSGEEFVLYQSLRAAGESNFYWYKQNNFWSDFKASNIEGYAMANVMSVAACNINSFNCLDPVVTEPFDAAIYPNPANDVFVFEAGHPVIIENVRVYSLNGQQVYANMKQLGEKLIQIDLRGNAAGVYFVRYNSNLGILTKKVLFYPERN